MWSVVTGAGARKCDVDMVKCGSENRCVWKCGDGKQVWLSVVQVWCRCGEGRIHGRGIMAVVCDKRSRCG